METAECKADVVTASLLVLDQVCPQQCCVLVSCDSRKLSLLQLQAISVYHLLCFISWRHGGIITKTVSLKNTVPMLNIL